MKDQLISAVLFDYGLVLTGPPNTAAWERMCSELGLISDDLHREYWLRRCDYDRGAMTGEAYWREIAAATGTHMLPPDSLARLLEADLAMWTDINEPMLAWAQDLQDRGVRTGILSNLGDRLQAGLVLKFAWLDRFHHRTWSHALGIAKPDPDIFLYAARGLDTPPGNILFIDDRADNIAAARAVGMKAVQYIDWSSFENALHAAGYADALCVSAPVGAQHGSQSSGS